MAFCLDFVEWLGPDTASSVLLFLEDPADLVRLSAVSRSWRRFVIENGFCKNFCSRICFEVSNFAHVTEISSVQSSEAGSSSGAEWRSLEREHRVYSYLSHCMVSPLAKRDCILEAICASSTDNFPDESIENTLEPNDRVDIRPSYWSSEGQKNPEVPETLTYSLLSKLCVINEIKIQPFEAYFQNGSPIYSAKSVRFRMGYCSSPSETSKNGQVSTVDDYRWIYVSPEFKMLQENALQSFKLPRPVLCIGGVLQIELLGRVQAQEMDGLYYICVCHVRVLGYPLTPHLDAEVVAAGNEIILKYLPEAGVCSSTEAQDSSGWQSLKDRIKDLRARARDGWHYPFLSTLLSAMESDLDDEEPPLGYW
ncbi:F-box protein At4g00755-like [Phalaenopsis equestris]|uniref:F-box protein At4g00755-like n=1 Tax=Phalaenopsis equestris TaxID=78828 RepID=UPI0009E5CA17|nr:F-box protein At4g00755-like [Phalaenopsis equestris]